MRKYRTLTEIEESYFRDHPEERDDYISIIFDEFSKDDNTGALLSSLHVLSRVKTIVLDAKQWTAFQKALNAPPRELPRLKKIFQEPSVFESE